MRQNTIFMPFVALLLMVSLGACEKSTNVVQPIGDNNKIIIYSTGQIKFKNS